MRILFLLICFLLPGSLIAAMFILNSEDIKSKQFINSKFTCEGLDISPELNWQEAPSNTKSFALIMSDPDAPRGTFYHWVLFNLPPDTNRLEQGQPLLLGINGKNSFGNTKYNGPCPPKGETHRYIFSLYALDSLIDTKGATIDAITLSSMIENHILAQTELTGLYQRKS